MYLVNVFLVIEDEGEKDNIDEETKTFQNEFPNLFSRNGKITNHDLKKTECNDIATKSEENSHSNAKSSRR